MRRFFLRTKRKWCRSCHTQRPHTYAWYKGVGEVCFFYKADTGLCGCSAIDPSDTPEYPSTPCHGGYQQTWTCCKCNRQKRELGSGWVICEIIEVEL
jgi:hypothetical protein